jgi:hypothetical protein
MVANLRGVRDKINRAKEHLAELEFAIQKWGTSVDKHNPFRLYPEANGKELHLRHGKVTPNDVWWALLVGDTIHNLRSALDHLVCQLAILNGKPVSCCEKTFFPICLTPDDFKKAERLVEPLIDPVAFSDIRDLQPYITAKIAGMPADASNLWIVHKLDIIDKHRILVIAGKFFRTTDFQVSLNDGPAITVQVDPVWRPLEDGTHIATVDMTPFAPIANPKNKVRVQGGTEVKVLITETGCGCDGLEVVSAIQPCVRHVEDVVDVFASKFFP